MSSRSIVVLILASMAIFAAQPATKTAAEQTMANPLIGTWKMTSWTRELTATGQKSDALGPSPIGWISYSRDGRMMVVVVRSDRKAPAALVPTDSERVSLYSSMLAYAGTYTVDDEKVTHTIDTSWNQAWTGTEQPRNIQIVGAEMTVTTPPLKTLVAGQEIIVTAVFDRSE